MGEGDAGDGEVEADSGGLQIQCQAKALAQDEDRYLDQTKKRGEKGKGGRWVVLKDQEMLIA